MMKKREYWRRRLALLAAALLAGLFIWISGRALAAVGMADTGNIITALSELPI